MEEIPSGSGRRPTEESWRDNRERECCEGDERDVPVEREEGWKLERSGGGGSQARCGDAMQLFALRIRMPTGMTYQRQIREEQHVAVDETRVSEEGVEVGTWCHKYFYRLS